MHSTASSILRLAIWSHVSFQRIEPSHAEPNGHLIKANLARTATKAEPTTVNLWTVHWFFGVGGAPPWGTAVALHLLPEVFHTSAEREVVRQIKEKELRNGEEQRMIQEINKKWVWEYENDSLRNASCDYHFRGKNCFDFEHRSLGALELRGHRVQLSAPLCPSANAWLMHRCADRRESDDVRSAMLQWILRRKNKTRPQSAFGFH